MPLHRSTHLPQSKMAWVVFMSFSVGYFPFSAPSAILVDLMNSAILYLVIMWVDYSVRNYPYTVETLSSMSVMTIWRLMGHIVIALRVTGES